MMWLRKLVLFLETKNLKKRKLGLWEFFLGFLKPKNLGYLKLKATSTALTRGKIWNKQTRETLGVR